MNDDPNRLFPKITDEALDALRRRLNVRIENTLEPWCHEATRDAIRHYAHGIGDDNPLWCDPDYAANTRWGGIVALPSFLFATSRIISGYVGGLPGVHAMWAGADWTWHHPGATQRRNQHRGLAEGPDRTRDAVCRPRDPAGLPCGFLQPARRDGGVRRQLVLPHRSRPGARTGQQVRRGEGTATAALLGSGSGAHLSALCRRGGARGDSALLERRCRRRSAADDGQGTDDGDRVHRLCAGLGRALHPREQACMETDPCTSRPRHCQPLRHSRLPGARPLGTGVRPHGRRARRLRLRPGALLVADAPSHQLDG